MTPLVTSNNLSRGETCFAIWNGLAGSHGNKTLLPETMRVVPRDKIRKSSEDMANPRNPFLPAGLDTRTPRFATLNVERVKVEKN